MHNLLKLWYDKAHDEIDGKYDLKLSYTEGYLSSNGSVNIYGPSIIGSVCFWTSGNQFEIAIFDNISGETIFFEEIIFDSIDLFSNYFEEKVIKQINGQSK